MKIALLINDRASRVELAGRISSPPATIDEFATAAQALERILTIPYDMIVMHWKVYPGQKPADSELQDLGAMIPDAQFARDVLYWEAGLRIIDLLRKEGGVNKATPVIVLLPDGRLAERDTEERLSRSSLERDLQSRQPASVISEVGSRDIAGIINTQRQVMCVCRDSPPL